VRVIDIHAHAWPDAVAAKAVPSLAEEGGVDAFGDGTIAGLVAAMDRAGIDASVVQPVATKPGQVRAINDWAATLTSARIVPFGAMHPGLEDPAAEIARMASLGLRGFKMHPEYQTFEPHEPRMDPIYAAASAHGLVVFFHAGADIAFPTVRGTPASFARVLHAWPGLKVVLAHLGGYRRWSEVTDLLAGADVWLDTAFTLGHLPDDELVALARAHGTGRVLLGTDAPWSDSASEIARLRSLPFSPSELQGILGGNAERLLGL
jgi:predicted TIM-barrel fold metal-dependent hydrolase